MYLCRSIKLTSKYVIENDLTRLSSVPNEDGPSDFVPIVNIFQLTSLQLKIDYSLLALVLGQMKTVAACS